MTTTLIIIGVFAGFFFLVVRPLQKKTGKYNVELPKEDMFTDPTFRNVPGNIFHHDD
ncbi:MAG: hypothetical protein M0Z75_00485 [Nitrospiraceae bacterium]|nr:hypothetical protein [Nitrospiraceae bacterium]MDA8091558.1 hypothetical protein [Nitrospiraceae bacterium]